MTLSHSDLVATILTPDAPVPDNLVDGHGKPAGRRFDVYRNNVAVSLTGALKTGFPVITRLLGAHNMDGLAGQFLRAHPPRSPLMMHYGSAFPDFLAAQPGLSKYGYLADVARLELALRQSYHAADAAPIDPATLGRLTPEQVMAAKATLAPAVRIVRSPWPILDIWRFNTEDNVPHPGAIAQDVLITRPDFDPVPQALPAGGADWILRIAAGDSVGAALDTAPDGFDLSTTLTLLLVGGALIHLNTEDAVDDPIADAP